MSEGNEVDELIGQLRRHHDEIDRVRRGIDAMVVKGRSRANEVEASVRGNGRLTGVSIDPAALRRLDAHDLGEVITEAVNDALDKLASSAQARFAPALQAASRALPR
jgi:DNA-binding protein YbaB